MAASLETPNITLTSDQENIFRLFNYNIVGMFCEYLNDIQSHSYDKLTDDWWLTLFNELDITNKFETDSTEIQKEILQRVIAEFSKDFFTQKQTEMFKENLEEVYKSFILDLSQPPHYCRIPGCIGDCGIQSCGICIDCCSCPMYW